MTTLITAEQLSTIADEFNYSDEHYRKAAIDKMNNNIFDDTTADDLRAIAKEFAETSDM